ncbi:hypothetical protein BDK51DRAFT_46862 [Blyttiomyces helicus]|uniref:Uncharacterized protein n=1 Tax=Blyttiomyces helicus TaxID=388810 RepID=A0A4V1IQA6_9FUNG|nr:hypothetical protein BDK51DRAFT_46862 [Blyttiomyces helicus]|eukprot:RKO85887.1 hypothetical protein BDK51DRAFT_46862 [Blyttiomyces helicus]
MKNNLIWDVQTSSYQPFPRRRNLPHLHQSEAAGKANVMQQQPQHQEPLHRELPDRVRDLQQDKQTLELADSFLADLDRDQKQKSRPPTPPLSAPHPQPLTDGVNSSTTLKLPVSPERQPRGPTAVAPSPSSTAPPAQTPASSNQALPPQPPDLQSSPPSPRKLVPLPSLTDQLRYSHNTQQQPGTTQHEPQSNQQYQQHSMLQKERSYPPPPSALSPQRTLSIHDTLHYPTSSEPPARRASFQIDDIVESSSERDIQHQRLLEQRAAQEHRRASVGEYSPGSISPSRPSPYPYPPSAYPASASGPRYVPYMHSERSLPPPTSSQPAYSPYAPQSPYPRAPHNGYSAQGHYPGPLPSPIVIPQHPPQSPYPAGSSPSGYLPSHATSPPRQSHYQSPGPQLPYMYAMVSGSPSATTGPAYSSYSGMRQLSPTSPHQYERAFGPPSPSAFRVAEESPRREWAAAQAESMGAGVMSPTRTAVAGAEVRRC